MARLRALSPILALALGACHVRPPTSPDPTVEVRPRLRAEALAYGASFLRSEWVMLHALARADRRFAVRMPLAGAERVALVRPVDAFRYAERDLALEEVTQDFARCSADVSDAWDAALRDHALEQELFARMLDEERARLDRERARVSARAPMLRDLTDFLATTGAPAQTEDAVVAWRLDQVREAVAPNALSSFERDELVHVARAIYREAEAWPRARAAAVRLGDEMPRAIVAPLETDGVDAFDTTLALQVGHAPAAEDLALRLQRARARVAAQLDDAFGALDVEMRVELLARASEALSRAQGPCRAIVQGSVMRSLSPPPERESACRTMRLFAEAAGETDEIVAWVVAHDRLTMALWAISLHGRDRSVETALRTALRTTWDPPPELVRAAAVDAPAAIVAGLAVELLLEEGIARAPARARKWKAFGDAPLHVVAREALGRRSVGGAPPLARDP